MNRVIINVHEPDPTDRGGAHGVQAAETLLQVLSAFIDAEPDLMLKTLSERAGMRPAKVHRYLVSLCRMGYVVQDPHDSRYRLGPAALRLGLAVKRTTDAISIIRPMMDDICRTLQHSVVLAVWHAAGPTVALKSNPPGLLGVNISEGTVLPILRSATGRAFAAWLPRDRTAPLIEAELRQLEVAPVDDCPATEGEVDRLISEVRSKGLARVTGQLNPSAHSFAAPVMDVADDVAAVLGVVGHAGAFDSRWAGPVARTLREVTAVLSHRLGHRGTAAERSVATAESP